MPCFIRAAKKLKIGIPVDVNEERLERLLMNRLKIPLRRHDRLQQELDRLTINDPEKLREMLISAIALAGKKEVEKDFPDRFKDLRKQAKKVWKAV